MGVTFAALNNQNNQTFVLLRSCISLHLCLEYSCLPLSFAIAAWINPVRMCFSLESLVAGPSRFSVVRNMFSHWHSEIGFFEITHFVANNSALFLPSEVPPCLLCVELVDSWRNSDLGPTLHILVATCRNYHVRYCCCNLYR